MKLFLRYLSAAALVFLLTGCSKKDSGKGSNKDSLKFSFPNPPSEVKTEDGVVVGSLKAFNLEISSPDPIEISVYSQSGCEKTHRIGNEKIDNSNTDISIDLDGLEDGIYKFHHTILDADSVEGSCTDSGFSYELDTSIETLELVTTGITSPSNNRRPSFTIQGDIEEGASVTLHDETDGDDCRGNKIPSSVSGNTITASLPEGHHTYKFLLKHTDSVGNEACSSNAALDYELDTDEPVALTLSLPPGVAARGNTTPNLVITGAIEDGAAVTIHDGDNCNGAEIPGDRTATFITLSALTTNKIYNFRAKHTDELGNFSCSAAPLIYELDTMVAVLTPSLPAGVTSPSNVTTPTLEFSGIKETGATITLHDGADCDGTAIPHTETGNTITVSTALTGEETYQFRLEHTDNLGNESCSAALEYKLDTTDPAALTLSLATGLSSTDNDDTPSLVIGSTVEGGGTIETGATVTLYGEANCGGTAIPHTGTGNTITVSPALTTDKTYNFHIKHTDEAGNSSCSASALDYVLDTEVANLTLSLATGVTSPSNDTTPSLVIGDTIETGATVTLHDGDNCSGAGITYTRADKTITVSPALTNNKTYKFRLKHTDSVGNVSCSASALDYVLDTEVVNLTLSLATGLTSPSKNPTPVLIIGGVIETGATVTLHDGADCDGAEIPNTPNANAILVSALTENKTYEFRLKHTDGAGNEKCSTDAFDYTLDTEIEVLRLNFVTGFGSPGNDTTPSLLIDKTVEDGATVTLHDGDDCNGTAIPHNRDLNTNSQLISISTPLVTQKTYKFRLKHTDGAGNSACSLAALDYVLDTTAPEVLTLSLATGTSPSKNTTPAFVIGGTIEDTATVTLHDGVDCSGSVILHTGTGPITVSPALDGDKTYNFRIKHTDEAGNHSCSAALDYKLDTELADLTLTLAAGLNPIDNDDTPSLVIVGEIETGTTITLHNVIGCGDNIAHTRNGKNISVSALADDSYAFHIKYTDEAGNTRCSPPLSYKLDTQIDVLTLSLAAGLKPLDNKPSPILVIDLAIEDGANVTLYGEAACAGAVIPHSGTPTTSITPTSLNDGTYNFSLKHTDVAGNVSCSTTALAYKLDTTIETLTLTRASGLNAVGKDRTPTLVIVGEIETGTTITLHNNETNCSTANVSHALNNKNINVSTLPTTEGTDYLFRIKYTDEAGNSKCSDPLSYRLDTTPPVRLSIALDGTNPTDNDTTPTFVINGVVDPNGSITLSNGSNCTGSPIETTTLSNDNKITISTPLPATAQKQYIFHLRHADEAGNGICSSSPLYYTLDTTAPAALTLSLASGTTSPSNDTTPSLVISGQIESGAAVTLHDGSSCTSSNEVEHSRTGNNITFNSSQALTTDKTYNFRIKHTDSAGNVKCSANALDYVLDTTAAQLSIAVDGGSPSNDDTPTFTITGAIETGATLTLHDGADCSGTDIDIGEPSGNKITVLASAALTDKTYSFWLKHTDSLNNTSCSAAAVPYVLDTTAAQLSIAVDGGSPSNNKTPTFTITGAIETGATLTLHDGADCSGTDIDIGEPSGNKITVLASAALTDKTYSFWLKHTDSLNNTSCSATAVPYVLDTTAAQLSIAVDGGSPGNDDTPTFTITGDIETGATVTLYDGAGCAGTNIGISAPTAGKKITVLASAALTDKTYSFWLKHTDSLNNTSCSAAAVPYVLDTTAAQLSIAVDGGSPSNNKTPTFTITGDIETGATLTLHDGADCSGTDIDIGEPSGNKITVLASAALTDKTYSFWLKHTDSLNNTSCSANALDYKLDTTAPAALTIALDGITSPNKETTPTFAITGTIETNASLTLYDGSGCGDTQGDTEIGIGAPASNKITVSTALSEGTYSFWLKHADDAGNSSCSAALPYVLDTTDPIALTLSFVEGTTSPSNDTIPSFEITGEIESGGQVTLHDGADCTGTAIPYTGTTTITVSTALTTNKTYNFRIKHADDVGNVSCSANALDYELDTTDPVVLSIALDDSSTSTDTTPTFLITGTIDPNGSVTLHDGSDCSGTEIGIGAPVSNKITVSTALAVGTYSFFIKHIDEAGNDSCSTPALTHTITSTESARSTADYQGRTPVPSLVSAVKQLVPGLEHTCALFEDGQVKCWGKNSDGQLGYGDTNNRGDAADEISDDLEFINLGTDSSDIPYTAKAISLGQDHTCAILNTGGVKCWGYNDKGQLGYGDIDNRGDDANEMGDDLEFINLGTDSSDNPYTAKAISLGQDHTCAILNNDKIKCWGENSDGQLGYGDTDNRGDAADEMGDNLLFVDLGTYDDDDDANTAEIDFTAKQIALGQNHTCAILNNDEVKCWGKNSDGQLGYDDTDNKGDDSGEMGNALEFINLGTDDSNNPYTAKTISSGQSHTCAVLNNDEIKCWGENSNE